jgi:hypothetical protein
MIKLFNRKQVILGVLQLCAAAVILIFVIGNFNISEDSSTAATSNPIYFPIWKFRLAVQ